MNADKAAHLLSTRIYLDHNATTRLDPEVLDAMLPFLRDSFGNPSSQHVEGSKARWAVEQARQHVARLIGAEPEEIVFTAGGTEADNLALLGVLDDPAAGRNHLVISAIEHQAVLRPAAALERAGNTVTRLPVNAAGEVAPVDASATLTPSTGLVSVMAANNEGGDAPAGAGDGDDGPGVWCPDAHRRGPGRGQDPARRPRTRR